MNFAETFDYLLFEHHMNAKTFAKKVGIDATCVTRYLRGERSPSVEYLILIADYFQCSAEFLLGREEETKAFVCKPCPPFSLQLKKMLKEYGYSCLRLAEETEIDPSSFYAWKSGKRMPSLDHLIKISDVLHCTVDYLLGRE